MQEEFFFPFFARLPSVFFSVSPTRARSKRTDAPTRLARLMLVRCCARVRVESARDRWGVRRGGDGRERIICKRVEELEKQPRFFLVFFFQFHQFPLTRALRPLSSSFSFSLSLSLCRRPSLSEPSSIMLLRALTSRGAAALVRSSTRGGVGGGRSSARPLMASSLPFSSSASVAAAASGDSVRFFSLSW